MCLLFETIKVADGKVCNLSYHQQRVAKSSEIDLLTYISSSVIMPAIDTIHKLRITYTRGQVCGHTIEAYTPRKIETLKIVIDDNIDYHLKFCDRSCLDDLMLLKGDCDDILIIKNGLVTDTSFANIVFFDGLRWVTPETPMLEGTCRARLIAEGVITPQIITLEDLSAYSKCMIINAMLDFNTQRAVEMHFNVDLCTV